MARILIADDSADILEAMKCMLELSGYEVRIAQDKNSLRREIEVFEPNLLLLDVQLGADDGRNICKEITEGTHHTYTPIILMSVSDSRLRNYKQYGAIDILEKPFHLSSLKEKIGLALYNASRVVY